MNKADELESPLDISEVKETNRVRMIFKNGSHTQNSNLYPKIAQTNIREGFMVGSHIGCFDRQTISNVKPSVQLNHAVLARLLLQSVH